VDFHLEELYWRMFYFLDLRKAEVQFRRKPRLRRRVNKAVSG
jgi:hypothetical protein